MRNACVLTAFLTLLTVCGCNFIGNGMPHTEKISIMSPETIDIQGDWNVEIICNANEDSVESTVDGNLQDYVRIKSGGELEISLPAAVRAMVPPTLKIRLQKDFSELSLEDSCICKVTNFDSKSKLEIELDDRAVCTFDKLQAENISAELSDHSKLSLKGKTANLAAEIGDRSVLEVSEVGNFYLECSGNSVCRVGKCTSANVAAEDKSAVTFKYVKDIRQRTRHDAAVDYPVNIPASLQK